MRNLPICVRMPATAGPIANGTKSGAADLEQAIEGHDATTWHRGVRLKLYLTGRQCSYSRA